jgi:hypothetical protein
MAPALRLIDPRSYVIARCGDPSRLYEELQWFATLGDRLLDVWPRTKLMLNTSLPVSIYSMRSGQ